MIIALLVIIMFSYSIWLSLIVFVGVVLMFFTTKYVGGNSGKYFMMQQKTLGKLEGYVEEMMHGAKVVKVFCHEEESKKDFIFYNNLEENEYIALWNYKGYIVMNGKSYKNVELFKKDNSDFAFFYPTVFGGCVRRKRWRR